MNISVNISLDLDVDLSTLKQDGEWTAPLILVHEFAGTRRDVRGTLTNRNLNNSFEFRLRSPIENLRPRIRGILRNSGVFYIVVMNSYYFAMIYKETKTC